MTVYSETLLTTGLLTTLCLLCGCLALIDLRRGIIPDGINLAVAGLGFVNAVIAGGVTDGVEAIAGAGAVGLAFWLFRRAYFALRGVQGLGLGDIKFLAAATPWVGIAGIPTLVLAAALTALLAIGGAQLAGQRLTRQTTLPFGPFLALGLLSVVAAQRWFGLI